jgi:pimeloyl-ACP methyl ester carboxylesterase
MKARFLSKALWPLFCLMLGVTIVDSAARADDAVNIAYRTFTIEAVYNKPDMSNDEAPPFLLMLGATKWQYTNGVPNVEAISPDNWGHVQPLLDRAGNQEIQLQMFYSYGSNPPLYPAWQEYLREYQPPTLIVWGKNDEIFPAAGAEPYKRDLRELEYYLIDTGHFALESHGHEIAELMRNFLNRMVENIPLAAN